MASRKARAVENPNATGPRGTIMRASGRHGPQVTESMGRFWTDEAEAIFLDELAATCNVTLAARASGFSGVTVYRRRRRDVGFAARWDDALAIGYTRLETALVRRATEMAEDGPDPDAPMPDMTVAAAINLLRLHKAGAAEHRALRGAGPPRRPLTLDDVRASILTKLEAIVAMSEEDAAAPDPGDDRAL